MDFPTWQNAALQMIPGSMVYTVELRKMWKAGLSPEHAMQKARNDGLVIKRGSAAAPVQVVTGAVLADMHRTERGPGRPKLVGIKRKPLWELAYIEAKIKAAVFAICVEAETHRLEHDALEFVRATKKKMAD